MDADSAGRRLSLSAHPGGIPPENAGGPTIPDPQVGKCEAGDRPPAVGCLWREGGKVMYQAFAGDAPKAVRVVWVKPLSGRGGAVSILLAGKKREAAFFASLDDIPADSRALVVEELAQGMILPRITAIRQVRPRFGNYYWEVDTDMGPRKFLLLSPENNTFRPAPDAIVIRDVSENCYEINPVSGLSRSSRRELDRVL